jgi:hypothetical protein
MHYHPLRHATQIVRYYVCCLQVLVVMSDTLSVPNYKSFLAFLDLSPLPFPTEYDLWCFGAELMSYRCLMPEIIGISILCVYQFISSLDYRRNKIYSDKFNCFVWRQQPVFGN